MCTTTQDKENVEMEKSGIEEEVEEGLLILQPMTEDIICDIEQILDYRFGEKKLLAEAFTHGSFYNPTKRSGPSYERLEFFGDAVLGCLMAREVFFSYTTLPPGQLTLLRAANVDKERLARVAVDKNLHRYIRHKAPMLDCQIQEFMEDMQQYPIHSNGLLDPPKALADIVESVIGAVFIDSNSCLETVWKVFRRLADPLISMNTLGKHPVSELYQLCQKNRLHVSFLKDEWMQSMQVDVLVDGRLFGSGFCSHKKEIAQNRAAKAALDRLKVVLENTDIDSCYSTSESLV